MYLVTIVNLNQKISDRFIAACFLQLDSYRQS